MSPKISFQKWQNHECTVIFNEHTWYIHVNSALLGGDRLYLINEVPHAKCKKQVKPQQKVRILQCYCSHSPFLFLFSCINSDFFKAFRPPDHIDAEFIYIEEKRNQSIPIFLHKHTHATSDTASQLDKHPVWRPPSAIGETVTTEQTILRQSKRSRSSPANRQTRLSLERVKLVCKGPWKPFCSL